MTGINYGVKESILVIDGYIIRTVVIVNGVKGPLKILDG
jgi:hypothetical protein